MTGPSVLFKPSTPHVFFCFFCSLLYCLIDVFLLLYVRHTLPVVTAAATFIIFIHCKIAFSSWLSSLSCPSLLIMVSCDLIQGGSPCTYLGVTFFRHLSLYVRVRLWRVTCSVTLVQVSPLVHPGLSSFHITGGVYPFSSFLLHARFTRLWRRQVSFPCLCRPQRATPQLPASRISPRPRYSDLILL